MCRCGDAAVVQTRRTPHNMTRPWQGERYTYMYCDQAFNSTSLPRVLDLCVTYIHSIRYKYLTCSDHNIRSPYAGEKINPNNAPIRARIVVGLALTISEHVPRYDN